jgi:SAM-dependent methyltransferase
MEKIQNFDLYDLKSQCYAELAWVRDETLFEIIFKNWDRAKFDRVIDLGCGPAALSYFVSAHLGVPYLGVDKSHRMVQKATRRQHSPKNLIVHADFTEPLDIEFADGFLVIKNVLHLFDDTEETIQKISCNYSGSRRFVIVETVSPSPESLEWIQALYLRLGLNFKKNWFVKGQLAERFAQMGIKCLRIDYHEQLIDSANWLASFQLSNESISLAEGFIENAPESVKREMKIKLGSEGTYSLLRLQNILEFDFPQ